MDTSSTYLQYCICTRTIYNVQCTIYNVQCTMYNVCMNIHYTFICYTINTYTVFYTILCTAYNNLIMLDYTLLYYKIMFLLKKDILIPAHTIIRIFHEGKQKLLVITIKLFVLSFVEQYRGHSHRSEHVDESVETTTYVLVSPIGLPAYQ